MPSAIYDEASLRGPPLLETTGTGMGSHVHRRISWAAIFGGVVLVIACQLLWSLLGAGIGLDTVNTNAGTTPRAGSIGLGAGTWWIISSVISLAFGGYVAAWLAGVEGRWDGILHGLVAWGIASVMAVYLLSSAVGGILGGSASALGGIAAATGNGLKEAARPLVQAAGLTPDMLRQQAQAYLQPTDADPATLSPQDAQADLVRSLASYTKGGPDAPAAKTRIVAVMAAQQHIPTEQAAKQFDDAQAKLQQQKAQLEQTARDAADATAAAAAKASFAAFAAILIGAIAAAVGGSLAAQRRLHATQRIVH